jgi:hypothetical protein
MIEKVRILEKDFPTGIPEDIGNKPLEVINEAGETIALFYSTAFMTEKFDDPVWYSFKYDEIFELIPCISSFEGSSNEEEGEEFRKIIDEINLDDRRFVGDGRTMVALGRLTYPYCFYEEESCLLELGCWYLNLNDEFIELLISYGDNKIISKLMDLLLQHHINYSGNSAEKLFNFLRKHNYSAWFESPDIFFTDENMDIYLELAQTSQNAELIAFLLDYKNKHFPSSTDYTLTLKD